jgi:type II secretory pathway pseudopilin PulG
LRRAFTLIELLVIVGIIAVMVATGVMSVRSGQDAARVRSAARGIYASIRRARAQALVTGKPTIISYGNTESDGEPVVKIEIHGVEIISSGGGEDAETLAGDSLRPEGASVSAADAGAAGESLAEHIFSPLSEEVLQGLRVKVQRGDKFQEDANGRVRQKSSISVWSTSGYVMEYLQARKKKPAAEGEDGAKEKPADAGDPPAEEEVSAVQWYTNGRVDPHRVWVYLDGRTPESGLMIDVDRFGSVRVLSGDGEDSGL